MKYITIEISQDTMDALEELRDQDADTDDKIVAGLIKAHEILCRQASELLCDNKRMSAVLQKNYDAQKALESEPG